MHGERLENDWDLNKVPLGLIIPIYISLISDLLWFIVQHGSC